jgi:AcrR family transcriptional regulator
MSEKSKKEDILDASRKLFNRLGFQKTSVDDIAQAVGMKKSSLYYYFKNKEEIFFEAFAEEWHERLDRLEAHISQEPDFLTRLFMYVRESVRYYAQIVVNNQISVEVLLETRAIFQPFLDRMNEKRVNFYIKVIEEGIAQGYFLPCDAEKVARSIMLVKMAVQYDIFYRFRNSYPTAEDFQDLEAKIIFVIDLMLSGLTLRK